MDRESRKGQEQEATSTKQLVDVRQRCLMQLGKQSEEDATIAAQIQKRAITALSGMT